MSNLPSTQKVFTHTRAGWGKPIGELLSVDPDARLPFVDMEFSVAVESHLRNITERSGYKEPSLRPKMAEVRSGVAGTAWSCNCVGSTPVACRFTLDSLRLSLNVWCESRSQWSDCWPCCTVHTDCFGLLYVLPCNYLVSFGRVTCNFVGSTEIGAWFAARRGVVPQ